MHLRGVCPHPSALPQDSMYDTISRPDATPCTMTGYKYDLISEGIEPRDMIASTKDLCWCPWLGRERTLVGFFARLRTVLLHVLRDLVAEIPAEGN